jgi:acetyl-CoA C-acetyltransferase
MQQEAFILGGLRSPFGRHAGKLAPVRPDDLAAAVLKATLERYGVAATALEDVILGCANQAGEDSRNVGRHAALAAGLPVTIPGLTVNRLCASGLAAVADAARCVRSGEGDLFAAGGVESMSRAPYVMGKAGSAYARDAKLYDTTIGARFPNPRILAEHGGHTMPETGDVVGQEQGLTREACDAFAAGAQARYARALAQGFFADELTAISVPPANGKGEPLVVRDDEHPRPSSDLAALARLKPLAPGGLVTAGNASGINDGAAILLVGAAAAAARLGAAPLARVVTAAVSGVEPSRMGLGPVEAIKKALARAGRTLAQMDVIEINEAFAPQVLACLKLLGLAADDERVNPNGGAIAVGHPLGASGARLALTATRQLVRTGGKHAVVSLCIGMGQGLAVVLERVG